jgi:hypothetical protein
MRNVHGIAGGKPERKKEVIWGDCHKWKDHQEGVTDNPQKIILRMVLTFK